MRQRRTAVVLEKDLPSDIPPSEDDVITDDVEYDQPVFDTSDDWHTGEPFEPLPDQVPTAAQLLQIMQGLTEVIRHERNRLAMQDKTSVRVSTNLSGSTQLRTYRVTSAMGAIQILWEKPFRGDTVITNQSESGSIWICDEPGLRAGGSNTVEIRAGAARTIRTREELFAITDSATEVVFDIQEEFDA